jgi:hypothetical protein
MMVPLILFAEHKLHALMASILMVIFWMIGTIAQLQGIIDSLAYVTMFTMVPFFLVTLLSVAPAKAVSRRLIFLALGLLLLIGLNELSKLGIDLGAPKQG